MAQTLSRIAAEERLRWLQPYLEGERTLKEMAEVFPFSYRTLKRWARSFRRGGADALAPRSRRPRHHPRQYPAAIVRRVRTLRQETRLGPDVPVVLLHREGIRISHSGIGKLLKREGLSRQRTRLQGEVERSHRTDRERFWARVRFRSLSEVRREHAAYIAGT